MYAIEKTLPDGKISFVMNAFNIDAVLLVSDAEDAKILADRHNEYPEDITLGATYRVIEVICVQ